jgi:imidazoleglycerol-phosphate dehydratase
MKRKSAIKRKTNEVEITGSLNIDGRGEVNIKTGINFLDHMLTLFAFFGLFDLRIEAKGDLLHHANEDVAISLGKAFVRALEGGKGIKRFGFAFCPMDKTLSRCVVDISGRPSFSFVCNASIFPALDDYSIEDAKQFLEAFANSAKITIQIESKFDGDTHHLIESMFKALGIALDMATQIDPRRKGISSTKGVIDL